MAFKYGIKDISALKFDEPLVDTVLVPITVYNAEYNFLEDWILNPDQPQDGIEITEHLVKIKKFKPNTWIIKSNYDDIATEEGFLGKFYGKQWEFNNLTENRAILANGDTGNTANWAHYPSNYNVIGFVLTPIRNDNHLATVDGKLNWPIAEGCLKDVSGAAQYGFPTNGTKTLYVCSWWFENQDHATPSTLYSCSNGYNDQMALAIFSSAEMDLEGNIPVQTYDHTTDPTTVEGFVGMLGSTNVYDKEKTYQHILTDYGLSFTETNSFVEGVGSGGWEHPEIPSTPGYPAKTAYVISTRGYDSQYEHMRLPAITDFAQLIENNFPFKFWARLVRGNARTHIWDSLVEAFRTTDITDGHFANHLFCRASGKKIDYIDDLYLNFNLPSVDPQTGEPIDSYIDLMGIFDGATNARCDLFKNIHFNIKSGVLKSMVNAFRYSDINSVTFNRLVNVTDWSGAFEGTTMTNFPENIAPGHQWNGRYSEPTTDMHYAADGSRLLWFGNYKDENAQTEEDKYFTALPLSAVHGLISRSDIREIKYIMDMKFVIPKAWSIVDDGTNAAFNATSLVTAKIKNLNKGDWSLDGTWRTNQYDNNCGGNIPSLDADSTNYLLNNIFDLKQNDQTTGDTAHFENELNSFNDWTLSSGNKRPIVFETWPNTTSTFSRTVTTAGIMKVKVGLTNCTLTMTNGGNTVTINGGDQTLNIATGNCTFTFTKTGNNAKGSMELDSDFHFLSELTPGLTNCSIYLPASLKSKASSLAIYEAQVRGWNVYFGGELEPVVTIEPCTFQFELDGESYADNNSNNEIRFYNKAGYHDSFTMEAPGTSIGSVNTSFETVSIPANTQHTNVYVTKSSTPFIVTIADDETSKEMQVNYTFDGDRNGQTVTAYAHFKNLANTSEPIKTLELIEGSGQYEYLELDDWFVSGGSVRVQVSFDLIAN